MRNLSKKQLLSFLLIFSIPFGVFAQEEILKIEDCYQWAKDNYPMIKKLELLDKTSSIELENVGKRYLPQVSFSGQATYQSETIDFGKSLGIPGIEFPTISKDQYKLTGEIQQLIYDGGAGKSQKSIIEANTDLQQQNIESALYNIRQRINSIFFSILLVDAQLQQNEIYQSNLQTQLQKTEAALKNGVAFKSNVNEIKAESVNVKMLRTELLSNRSSLLKVLSIFISKELSDSINLETPKVSELSTDVNRPELRGFELQKEVYSQQEKLLKSAYLPQIGAFFQGIYGRPTFNIIDNSFNPAYITGIRFNWALGSLYTLSNKRNSIQLQKQAVDIDRETFMRNIDIDVTQQDEQVKKYVQLISQDQEIIQLRQTVTQSAEAQLKNGVITTHEYIQKLNAENLAQQTLILHQIQLLQARYNKKFITGN